MDLDLDTLQQQAVSTLRHACHSQGIRPGPDAGESKQEVRTRDAMISGIAGLLAGDDHIIQGFRNSIVTLVNNQHPQGMIPTKVHPGTPHPDISYGRMAGRVDTNTWFLIGTCIYLLNRADGTMITKLQPRLKKVLELLDRWEYNANGLLYTPLSGNWADEYTIQGHTLYDNLLRLWALKLYNKLFEDEERKQQERKIQKKITLNFWPDTAHTGDPNIYHARCFEEAATSEPDHFACAIDSRGYDMHFDTAANGLALMMDLASTQQYKQILNHLKPIFRQVSTVLMPAFWPVITSDDPQWNALKNNFNGTFKNYPHQYQNGGIWPVWMGWFAIGTNVAGSSDLPETMLRAWMKIEREDDISFCKYISSDTLKKNGSQRFCSSAAGLLFLIAAIKKDAFQQLHIT
jgi:hypothetical protein